MDHEWVLLSKQIITSASEEPSPGLDPTNFGASIWQPLHHADSIRLFSLSRNPRSDKLRFHLSEHRLSSPPDYQAVSYVWGEPGRTTTIENARGQFVVRLNLAALLENLYSRIKGGELDADTLFWIDALCIDQESLSEKAQQVRQIGHTFGRSSRVLVWLGTHEQSDDSYLSFLPQVGNLSDEATIPTSHWRRLSTHQYWTRAWVIQEFVDPRVLILFDKSNWSPGHDFEQMFQATPSHGSEQDIQAAGRGRDTGVADLDSLMGRIVSLRLLWQKLRKRRQFRSESPLSITARFCAQSCYDPRDKVFALLSLTEPTFRDKIKVDYSISIGDLFWEVLVNAPSRSILQFYRLKDALQLRLCCLIPTSILDLLGEHFPHQEQGSFRASDLSLKRKEWNPTGYRDCLEVSFIMISIHDLVSFTDNGVVESEARKRYYLLSGEATLDNQIVHTDCWSFALILHREKDKPEVGRVCGLARAIDGNGPHDSMRKIGNEFSHHLRMPVRLLHSNIWTAYVGLYDLWILSQLSDECTSRHNCLRLFRGPPSLNPISNNLTA